MGLGLFIVTRFRPTAKARYDPLNEFKKCKTIVEEPLERFVGPDGCAEDYAEQVFRIEKNISAERVHRKGGFEIPRSFSRAPGRQVAVLLSLRHRPGAMQSFRSSGARRAAD